MSRKIPRAGVGARQLLDDTDKKAIIGGYYGPWNLHVEAKIDLVTRATAMAILDSDLAKLYGVETRRLNEQVRRNIEKFPEDFAFKLTKEEFANLKSQIAISSSDGFELTAIIDPVII